MNAIILLLGFNALAFWQRHVFLYILVAVVDIVWGLNFAADATLNSTDWVMGVIAVVIGAFCLYRAATKGVKG